MTLHTTTELQRKLIQRGFLAKGGDDGIFGQRSMDAYNHYLASKGKPPHTGMLLLAELNAELFPEEQTAPAPKPPNPLQNWLISLATKSAVSKLKGLPMLTGYKTYATAAVLAIVAAYSLIFGDLPGLGHVDPANALMNVLAALGLVFGRTGAKTEAAKVGQ